MPAYSTPSIEHSGEFVLTLEALALLDRKLREHWDASAWRQESKTGKMTRPVKSRLLGLDVKTIDRIYRRQTVHQTTLRHAFDILHITPPFSPEQYCVFISSEPISRFLPGFVPRPLTHCFGRENQVDEIVALLEAKRLVTLTGAGGVGKTRLAVQVAEDMQGRSDKQSLFEAGVWFVELADIEPTDLDDGTNLSDVKARVLQVIAATLGLSEEPPSPLLQTLMRFLQDKRLLLILDNCEHLAAACAALVYPLLSHCPLLKILATSREKLGIPGEHPFRVPSLTLPDLVTLSETEDSVSRLHAAASVQLFVERARLQRSDFTVTPQNAALLASLCHRLDGIPLALELAAARMRSMELETLVGGLEDCLALLQFGNRAVPRHETLQATMDWSYTRLEKREQSLLRRLSVFAGGWTAQAAQRVCQSGGNEREDGSEIERLNVLTSLADKSLVVYDASETGGRYRLLETVRQYGWARLAEGGEEGRIRIRHRDYFLALAEKSPTNLPSSEPGEWLQRMECEHDNLRAALAWSLEEADPFKNLRLCGALQEFWDTRGYLSEGRQWCRRALEKANAQTESWTEERSAEYARVRAQALNAAGGLAYSQGDYDSAHAYYQECLKIRQGIGDELPCSDSWNNLGLMAFAQGEYEEARDAFLQSLEIRERLGLKEVAAYSHDHLGMVAHAVGDYPGAQRCYEKSLTLFQKIKNPDGIAYARGNLGLLALDQGHFSDARTNLEASLARFNDAGYQTGIAETCTGLGLLNVAQGQYAKARPFLNRGLTIRNQIGDQLGIAESLEACARLAAAQTQTERAARLWGAAEALRLQLRAPRLPSRQKGHEKDVAAARAAGDAQAFQEAWNAGLTMTAEQAVALAK